MSYDTYPRTRTHSKVNEMKEAKLNRRQCLRVGGGAAVAALLAGCTGGDGDDGGTGTSGDSSGDSGGSESLTVWAWNDPGLKEARTNQASQFKEQHSAAVNWQYYPWSDYLSKLTSSVSSGSAPDSMALSVLWTPRFGSRGTVPDLGEMGFDPSQFLTAGRDNSSYQGTLYACPWYIDCRLIAINKTKFEEAGLNIPDPMTAPTWEQFGTWLDELGKDGGTSFVMAPGEGLDAFILSNGGSYLNEDGSKTRINSKEAVEAAEFLKPYVVDKGVVATREGTKDLDEFISGNAAMAYAGSWEYGRLQDTDIDWQYVPIPKGPSGDSSHSWSAGVYYSIPAKGGNTELGKKWLEYMISDEVQSSVVEVGGFPATKSAYDSEKFKSYIEDNPKLKVVEQEIENSVSFPSHPEVGEMWNIAHTAAERIWQGQQEPKAALDGAAKEFQSLL